MKPCSRTAGRAALEYAPHKNMLFLGAIGYWQKFTRSPSATIGAHRLRTSKDIAPAKIWKGGAWIRLWKERWAENSGGPP